MNEVKTTTQDSTESGLVCNLAAGSRIKLIGLGGVGCIVLQYLALFLRSLNVPIRLVLIDGDEFEPSNAKRMAFSVIGNKADVKVEETLGMLGTCDIATVAVPEYVTAENIERLIRPGDHVALCVDNHGTRRLVAEHCSKLSDIALFSGGNDGVDPPTERGTYGNVQIHIRRAGEDLTVPITRFHPEIANAVGKPVSEQNCGQMAVSMPQILFANLAVASAMLNAFYSFTCGELRYQEVKFDIIEGRVLPQLPLKRDQIPQPLASPL